MLGGEDLLQAGLGQVDEAVELGAGVAAALGCGLGFDQAAVGGHDDVHVHFGLGVFFVAEVEEAVSADDADGGGGDQLTQGRGLEGAGLDQRAEGDGEGDAAPVMAAVRVPPSAWMTSQSRMTVRSPRAFMSTTERRLRPMRRWISWVRPPILPFSLSRGVRVRVERGSMEYSAVTQPRPELRSQAGTPGSMVALQRTRVFPRETRTEPSAVWTKPGARASGRSWSGVRPPGRKKEA